MAKKSVTVAVETVETKPEYEGGQSSLEDLVRRVATGVKERADLEARITSAQAEIAAAREGMRALEAGMASARAELADRTGIRMATARGAGAPRGPRQSADETMAKVRPHLPASIVALVEATGETRSRVVHALRKTGCVQTGKVWSLPE